jgi:hypothetical protein
MKAGIILALSPFVFPTFAQEFAFPTGLATTYDGSVLYFSNSAGKVTNSKIYRWTENAGLTVFAQQPGYHLYGTELTYAGTIIYHAEPYCSTGTGPGFNNCTVGETRIVTPKVPTSSQAGFLLISPNGQFGVSAPFNGGVLWTNFVTGRQIQVPVSYENIPNVSPPFFVNQHAVANNGSFLTIADSNSVLSVWTPGGLSTVLPSQPGYTIDNAEISADGSAVAVTTGDHVTTVYDLAFGTNTKFPVSLAGDLEDFSMSADGKTVAYLSASTGQATVANSDGTNMRQVTNVPGGLSSVLISGDANFVFVLTASFEIQRYQVATGAVVTIPAEVAGRPHF